MLASSYAAVAVGAEARSAVTMSYESSWTGSLGRRPSPPGRADDLRRGTNLVGPHRDELALHVGGLPARTHASQGEQRSLALALRLASHAVVAVDDGVGAGAPPRRRLQRARPPTASDALLAALPAGQALLTSASGLPPGPAPERVLRVEATPVARAAVCVSRLVDA